MLREHNVGSGRPHRRRFLIFPAPGAGTAIPICAVRFRSLDGNALFTNEHGSSAWGTVSGDRVFIPEWNEGRGERGVIRGNRIVWPNGTYWARYGY